MGFELGDDRLQLIDLVVYSYIPVSVTTHASHTALNTFDIFVSICLLPFPTAHLLRSLVHLGLDLLEFRVAIEVECTNDLVTRDIISLRCDEGNTTIIVTEWLVSVEQTYGVVNTYFPSKRKVAHYD